MNKIRENEIILKGRRFAFVKGGREDGQDCAVCALWPSPCNSQRPCRLFDKRAGYFVPMPPSPEQLSERVIGQSFYENEYCVGRVVAFLVQPKRVRNTPCGYGLLVLDEPIGQMGVKHYYCFTFTPFETERLAWGRAVEVPKEGTYRLHKRGKGDEN